MKKYQPHISFLLSIFLVVFLVLSCSKIKEMLSDKDKTTKEETTTKEKTLDNSQDNSGYSDEGGRLYFCEDYVQKEEINKGTKFSTGRLTVMVRTNKQIYDRDVQLKLERLNDDGTKEFIKTIDFTVPVNDYFYFKHKDLGFSSPGLYRVTLLGKDKRAICSGEVTITP